MDKHMMLLGGKLLKGDPSFKFTKHMAKIGEPSTFIGLYTLTNEHEEICNLTQSWKKKKVEIDGCEKSMCSPRTPEKSKLTNKAVRSLRSTCHLILSCSKISGTWTNEKVNHFADGVGRKRIIMESSSGDAKENIEHTIEDSFKLVSTTISALQVDVRKT
ncbi:hypothetical protein K501DRAFT_280789 [Backusella circina FSU 941]|nr:hypothetical protein K501DRAFT_280789 [Backusella circina FSU 941]